MLPREFGEMALEVIHVPSPESVSTERRGLSQRRVLCSSSHRARVVPWVPRGFMERVKERHSVAGAHCSHKFWGTLPFAGLGLCPLPCTVAGPGAGLTLREWQQ